MAPTRQTKRKPTSPSDDPVTAYARDVVAGRVVHGPHVRNACRRHLLDLDEGPIDPHNSEPAAIGRQSALIAAD